MLVAVACFVIQGTALAVTTALVNGPEAAGGHPGHATHDHAGAAHVHSAAHATAGQEGDASGPDGSSVPCCGHCCTAAIPPVLSAFMVDRAVAKTVPPTFSVVGRGIAQEGLRRPPRTSDIA